MYDSTPQNKRATYVTAALLSVVFVAAGAMFAVPAWSQSRSEDSQKGSKASKEKT
jgi:flagellar basal body-associated protein FliL